MNFMLPHPFNIIISAESIGDYVQINQNVTIGGNMKKTCVRPDGHEQKLPRIGNNVVIYTNAIVGGPVEIGDNVIIGGNATCTHDVPSNSIFVSQCRTTSKRIEVESGSFRILEHD